MKKNLQQELRENRGTHNLPFALAVAGMMITGALIFAAFFAPEFMQFLLGSDATRADQLTFAGIAGIAFAVLPMAHAFSRSFQDKFQEMRDDLDSIERRLRKADEGSSIWSRLESGPVSDDPIKSAVKEIAGINSSSARTAPEWFGIAEFELHKAASRLEETAREMQAGTVTIHEEDWTRLQALFKSWRGTIHATSAPGVDGDDFWRDTPERREYMSLHREVLKSGRVSSVKRIFLINAAVAALLKSNAPQSAEFLETIRLNVDVGVDVRFMETEASDDFIVFDPKRTDGVDAIVYEYTKNPHASDVTTISRDEATHLRRSEQFDTMWSRSRNLDEFLRQHDLSARFQQPRTGEAA